VWFIYNTIIKNVVLDVYHSISDVSYVSLILLVLPGIAEQYLLLDLP
jgi:hypothetical protein